ncbi:DUF6702 family protein [Spirosoma pomorum]
MAGCLISSRPLTLHDFHASVTQMQYNPQEKAFEISIRIFTDDLEKTLAKEVGKPVDLSVKAKNDPLLEKYIRAHFTYLNPQRQAKPFTYVGHEVEDDANWLYLEMPYDEAFQGGVMRQNILMEVFDDQVNMVNIQYKGQKKTFVFRKNQPIQAISL